MLYQGNGMLVGNSSSGNNGAGKVVQVSLDNYLAYSGMTPSKIGKSSKHLYLVVMEYLQKHLMQWLLLKKDMKQDSTQLIWKLSL